MTSLGKSIPASIIQTARMEGDRPSGQAIGPSTRYLVPYLVPEVEETGCVRAWTVRAWAKICQSAAVKPNPVKNSALPAPSGWSNASRYSVILFRSTSALLAFGSFTAGHVGTSGPRDEQQIAAANCLTPRLTYRRRDRVPSAKMIIKSPQTAERKLRAVVRCRP